MSLHVVRRPRALVPADNDSETSTLITQRFLDVTCSTVAGGPQTIAEHAIEGRNGSFTSFACNDRVNSSTYCDLRSTH